MLELEEAPLVEVVAMLEDVCVEDVAAMDAFSIEAVALRARVPTTRLDYDRTGSFYETTDLESGRRNLLRVRIRRVEKGKAEHPKIIPRKCIRSYIHIPIVRCGLSKIDAPYVQSQSSTHVGTLRGFTHGQSWRCIWCR
jgi:hypothetical protein